MTQKCNLFFCLGGSQRECSDLSFFLFLLFFFSSLAPLLFILSIAHCLQWVQFSLMSRWSFLSLTVLLAPTSGVCGAFSWSQSCRPGLDERRRSSKSLGIGDLNALQSEPCRVQIERVILLLKLSAAPQMAFVRARDMLGDRVRVTVSFRLGESLGSAGKALWGQRDWEGKTLPWIWTADRNKIGGLEQREGFNSQRTHKYTLAYTEWD